MNSGILVEWKTEQGIQNLPVKRGISLRELADDLEKRNGMPSPVFATVNGQQEDLDYILRHSSQVEYFGLHSRQTRLMYQRTVYFVFQKAVHELDPEIRTRLLYPLNGGLLIEFDRMVSGTGMMKWNIEKRMKELISEGKPFEQEVLSRERILSPDCPAAVSDRMVSLVRNSDIQQLYLYSSGEFSRVFTDLLMPSPKGINLFELVPYEGRVIIRVPHFGGPEKLSPYRDDKKLYRMFGKVIKWREITEVNYIDDLNRKIDRGEWRDLILISEAQHEKNIASIADQIRTNGRRIILIAGPSASGKTTFAQRLCIQLRVNGLRPLYMGTDDYFRERGEMIPDENGKLNFEDLTAVDVELFNSQMNDLLDGKTVDMPVFDFMTGSKRYGVRVTNAEEDQPIVIEGIHALNPELTRAIAENEKFRIYICPLTVLNIDEDNRIPVTDIRLIRRMARDMRS